MSWGSCCEANGPDTPWGWMGLAAKTGSVCPEKRRKRKAKVGQRRVFLFCSCDLRVYDIINL